MVTLCELPSAFSSDATVPHLDWALEVRSLLQSVQGDRIACAALAKEFDADVPSENQNCRESVTNRDKSVIFRLAPLEVAGGYEVFLRANSKRLILGRDGWCERHKLDVFFAYDSNLYPSILVLDTEPMVRTTPKLEPEDDGLFEYLPRQNDRQILDLQKQIRNAIVASLYNFINAERARLSSHIK